MKNYVNVKKTVVYLWAIGLRYPNGSCGISLSIVSVTAKS